MDDFAETLFTAMMLNIAILIAELDMDGMPQDRIVAACDEFIWETEARFPGPCAEQQITAGMADAARAIVADL